MRVVSHERGAVDAGVLLPRARPGRVALRRRLARAQRGHGEGLHVVAGVGGSAGGALGGEVAVAEAGVRLAWRTRYKLL